MDPVVIVDKTGVSVEPGAQATVRVRVRNRSGIVERFRIDVVGEAADWAQLLPPELEVRPQEEAETIVVFSPPAGIASPAGQVPFGIRAVSQVDPDASAVAEGDLRVGSVALSQGTISPVTSHGRFSAKHRIEMANWGNAPIRLRLEVSDPDEALGFLLVPDVLDLPIGTTGRARLKVRARKPIFRGMPVRRPFRVVGRLVAPGEDAPAEGPLPPLGFDPTQPAVDGAYEQRPILGRGIIPLAVGAVVVAGVIGWLSTRSSDDLGAESAAPPAPEAFAATPLSHDTVRLSWRPGERVDTYTVLTVDPATAGESRPTAVDVVEDIPGDQGSFDVKDLEPSTSYCFQLAAVRNDLTSPRAPAQCVDTLQLAGAGAPAAPREVTVEPAEEGKARVAWQDASGGQADHIIIRDGSLVEVVDHPKTEGIVDLASGENCFQVQAKQGDVTSAPVPEPCVALPSDGGDGTTTDSTVAAELGVIAVVDVYAIEDINSLQRALARRDERRAAGEQADVLDTSRYPALASASGNYYYVYLRGFSTLAEAETYCETNGCLAYDLSSPAPSP